MFMNKLAGLAFFSLAQATPQQILFRILKIHKCRVKANQVMVDGIVVEQNWKVRPIVVKNKFPWPSVVLQPGANAGKVFETKTLTERFAQVKKIIRADDRQTNNETKSQADNRQVPRAEQAANKYLCLRQAAKNILKNQGGKKKS